MTFVSWLGLIALIGIPILIIIYLIKPKFQERKISSTYIWKLSLKYRKRKLPLQWLKSLLLIVQCILVAVLTILIARPIIAKSYNSYKYEKIIILDGSASMMTESNGKTRFERGKEKIYELIGPNGANVSGENPITVILIGETTARIVDQEANGAWARHQVEEAECSGKDADLYDYIDAINDAKKIASTEGSDARIMLITDHTFEGTDENGMNGYIQVFDVSDKEWNFAVVDAFVDIEDNDEDVNYGDNILVANIVSYNKDVTVIPCAEVTYMSVAATGTSEAEYQTATLKLDPIKVPAFDVKEYEKNLQERDEDPTIPVYTGQTQVVFPADLIKKPVSAGGIGRRLKTYTEIKYYFIEADSGKVISSEPIELSDGSTLENLPDAFGEDDIFFDFSGENNNYKVLVVDKDAVTFNSTSGVNQPDASKSFTYQVVSAAAGELPYDVDFASDPNAAKNSGYDLYVYDGCLPNEIPDDGAVWLLDPPAREYADLGFTVGGEITAAGTVYLSGDSGKLSRTADIARVSTVASGHSILNNIDPEADTLFCRAGDKGIFTYSKYKSVPQLGRNYNVLVTSENGSDPLIFAGKAQNNCNVAVFAFDVNNTDLPLVFTVFPQLVVNMLDFSTSRMMERGFLYDIGDLVPINAKPNATKLTVSVGDKKQEYFKDVSEGGQLTGVTIDVPVERSGVYTVTQTFPDGTETSINFFVRCNEDESNFNKVGPRLVGENDELKTEEGTLVAGNLDITDISKWFAIALIVLILLEWGLQYREQY